MSAFINKQIVVTPEQDTSFIPEHSFADFSVDISIKNAISKKGYKTPTPIQDVTIPHILKGRDVVGIANTGTGKTAAFLIPLINKVIGNPNEKVIVVVPTRELANQINQELKAFVAGMNIFSVCCVGGTSIVPQMRDLSRKNNFVIGTPGRLKDLIERKKIDMYKINTIVLDEADVMLDMGFIHDMRYLVARMPRVRHTLFFSATLSKEIEKLIHDFLDNPVHVSVKTRETPNNVEQEVVKIRAGEQKIEILGKLLVHPDFSKVLIFGRTKYGVEKLSRDLHKKGFLAESIHGNKNYNQRQRALATFKENKLQILVATDVASRGLDIPNVSHVINYDMPNSYDDYIHRIGRTGRWGKKGKALTFV
ncbi:MAG: hypothetical protein A2919_02135 [Candidatus Spechtbacteria bacterium RIFCSPLOWO2_01_FULL_43_12]|uniref:RNA helicase n=1 Tax=Candidatus Spechtbacteria bacterium RIFCSPLOWO2_01_FULL_43_12 TaxID=1802162 RepID=A0A1G2HDX1_9BACT|nr:MAG: hypothetical protein A2919_02135 [Candidatus Spechtbacteria bacterium RIFCSPLOWO2_01_FULL_43_12]